MPEIAACWASSPGSDENGDRHPERHHQRDLRCPRPNPRHEQIGTKDPQGLARDQLEGTRRALADRQADHDYRRDRSEERRRMPDQVAAAMPQPPGRRRAQTARSAWRRGAAAAGALRQIA